VQARLAAVVAAWVEMAATSQGPPAAAAAGVVATALVRPAVPGAGAAELTRMVQVGPEVSTVAAPEARRPDPKMEVMEAALEEAAEAAAAAITAPRRTAVMAAPALMVVVAVAPAPMDRRPEHPATAASAVAVAASHRPVALAEELAGSAPVVEPTVGTAASLVATPTAVLVVRALVSEAGSSMTAGRS